MTLNRRTLVIAGVALAAVVATIVAGLALSGGGGDDEASTTTTVPERTTTTEPLPPCPLTGVPARSRALLARPALAVKYDNVDPNARPPVGINAADLVYEERVEGSVTRFMAIFHCADAAPIGPVRSARTSDIPLFTPLNRPLFAWSGSNAIFAARIQQSNIIDVGHSPASDQYYRDGSRRAPHNLFIEGSDSMIRAYSRDDSAAPPQFFTYRDPDTLPQRGRSVRTINIRYGASGGAAPVDYEWTGDGWARTERGTPHVDSNGRRIEPENVIIQFVHYVSSGVNDGSGNPIPEASLIGEGEAWVLTGGRLLEARWRKTSLDAVTTYVDGAGRPVRLTPGRTWVALPPIGGASIGS